MTELNLAQFLGGTAVIYFANGRMAKGLLCGLGRDGQAIILQFVLLNILGIHNQDGMEYEELVCTLYPSSGKLPTQKIDVSLCRIGETLTGVALICEMNGETIFFHRPLAEHGT